MSEREWKIYIDHRRRFAEMVRTSGACVDQEVFERSNELIMI